MHLHPDSIHRDLHGEYRVPLLGFRLRLHDVLLLASAFAYVAMSFSAWDWPAVDGYPAIERWLDPAYLSNDFYTNTTEGYGVDTAQAMFFGMIERLVGLSYEVSIAILNLLRCLVFPWVLYGFFYALTNSRQTAVIAVVLGTLSNFELPMTLAWGWLWGDGSPAMLAMPVIVLSWTFALRRRLWASFLLMAIACLIHPLMSVYGAMLVAFVFVLDYSGRERVKALLTPADIASGLIFCAIFTFQYLLLSPGPADRLPTSDYIQIVAYERHPGDFLASHFEVKEWVAALSAVLAVALILWRRWTDIARPHLFLGTLAAYVAFGFAGYLFVEVWPIRVFVELMPFRTVVMAVPFMLAVIASFAAGELRAKRYFIFAGLAVTFLLASPYGRRLGVPLPVPGLLLLGIVALGLLIEAKAWRIAPGILQAGLSPMRLGASALVLLILLAVPAAIARRSAFVIPTRDNQHPLYAWAFENTPRDARFLVEQFSSSSAYSHAISPQKMRLVGQRAVIASRDFPFLDRDIKAWAWTWLLVLDNGTSDRVERADVSTLLSINEAFPFDYVVRRTPLLPSSAFESVVAFGPVKGVDRLLVYRVSR